MSRMLIALSFLMSFSLATFAHDFGSSGSSGSNGHGGHNGKSGEDVSIIVDGKPLELRLDGEDGTPGQNAGNGEDASGCYFSPGVGKQYGAPGGSAGHGGEGGSGGRGGHATFFVKNLSDLSSIFLSQVGGKGAAGGNAGKPGNGCGCHTSSWTAQTCNTRRVCSSSGGCSTSVSCTDRTFYCYPGQNGYAGSPGPHGSNGDMGSIRILTDLKEIPSESPAYTIDLKTFKENVVDLSKIIWEKKSGARKLFAANSNINDEYDLFIKKAEKKVVLSWNAGREINDFQNEDIALLFDGQSVKATYSGSHLLKIKVVEEAELNKVVVEKAYRKEDLLLVSLNGIEGSLDNTVISLKDISGLGTLIKNSVELSFSYKHWLKGWTNVFNGTVPADAVEVSDGEIKIKAGKLDIKDKVLKKGSKVRFQLTLNRSIESMSSKVSLPQSEDTL